MPLQRPQTPGPDSENKRVRLNSSSSEFDADIEDTNTSASQPSTLPIPSISGMLDSLGSSLLRSFETKDDGGSTNEIEVEQETTSSEFGVEQVHPMQTDPMEGCIVNAYDADEDNYYVELPPLNSPFYVQTINHGDRRSLDFWQEFKYPDTALNRRILVERSNDPTLYKVLERGILGSRTYYERVLQIATGEIEVREVTMQSEIDAEVKPSMLFSYGSNKASINNTSTSMQMVDMSVSAVLETFLNVTIRNGIRKTL
jgi:hypothetical protein